MANSTRTNFYANPAFCQQSEYYCDQSVVKSARNGLSPQKRNRSQNVPRQSPVGAQSPIRILDNSGNIPENVSPKPKSPKYESFPSVTGYQEQDFYEEMLVDDTGTVQQQKIVVVPANVNNKKYPPRYLRIPQEANYVERNQENGRYATVPTNEEELADNPSHIQKSRYDYLQPVQGTLHYSTTSKNTHNYREEYELGNRRIHRYEIVEVDDETDFAEESRSTITEHNTNHRYEIIPHYKEFRQCHIEEMSNSSDTPQPPNWKGIIHQQKLPQTIKSPVLIRKPSNAYATQKLQELITTPKKPLVSNSPMHYAQQTPQKIKSPHSPRRQIVLNTDPFIVTPNKNTLQRSQNRDRTPKAQQKLSYTLSTRHSNVDKRNMAVVSPICTTPHSIYSETTFSNKSESWLNLSSKHKSIQATLTIAAGMMLICGSITSGLCFYMISVMGQQYFLQFGIVSGFACLVLGFLGCRSRNHYYWLPNRNYMSGYIILTLFSLLTCGGLLVLLFMQPKPGSPLADMTSGAVCGISVLSLILATAGVMSSYCCKLPPPDNRVEHCAQGFIV